MLTTENGWFVDVGREDRRDITPFGAVTYGPFQTKRAAVQYALKRSYSSDRVFKRDPNVPQPGIRWNHGGEEI